MSQTNKPKVTVEVYEQFPRHRSAAAPHQVTWDQVRKYLSTKPLRRAPSRTNGTDPRA